jgi:hypothetical protein
MYVKTIKSLHKRIRPFLDLCGELEPEPRFLKKRVLERK